MADDTATADQSPITFNVKASNDAKYTLTLPLSTSVSELKELLSASDYADTPAERQRLIYSGRVLKDNETLGTYKIKDGHTVHLVKSAASNPTQSASQRTATSTAAGPAANPAASGVPTNLAAGTGNNPLAGLTGARYAGFAQLPGANMFGPDGGMGPPPDPDTMLNMLENPQFQSTINEALQNPDMIDMMIQQNPLLRDMGPGVRQMMQSPDFRRMLTDPNSLRQVMQMQRAMGGGGMMGGMGGMGGGGGASAFPAPGVTNTTPEENRTGQEGATGNNNAPSPLAGLPPFNPFVPQGMGAGNPFAALFGGNPANNNPASPNNPQDSAQPATGDNPTGQNQNSNPQATNPLAGLLNPAMFGNGQGGAGGINPFNPQSNPFLRDPALMAQMMQAMNGNGGGEGGAGGANPLAALLGGGGGGFGAAPPDNRPPEERYAEQLRQLNDMGFFEFERNIEALRRAGGSVQGAVEYLLSHPS